MKTCSGGTCPGILEGRPVLLGRVQVSYKEDLFSWDVFRCPRMKTCSAAAYPCISEKERKKEKKRTMAMNTIYKSINPVRVTLKEVPFCVKK